jgi:hypothetical protein
VNKNVGFFYASQSGVPYKTIDGGATWTSIPFPLKKTATVLKFYNESIGLAAVFPDAVSGGVPWLYRTTNGGASWLLVKVSDEQGWGEDIEFVPGDPSKVWYSSSKSIFFSADTGRTWAKQAFDSLNVSAYDISLVPGGYGWIASSNGAIYRTSKATAVYNIQTTVDRGSSVPPSSFMLEQNYPNPFNPATTISYALPQPALVVLKVYDVLGRECATLINEYKNQGRYEVSFDAGHLPSGMYIYQIQAGAYSAVRTMQLIK